jgi:hypothetical protein
MSDFLLSNILLNLQIFIAINAMEIFFMKKAFSSFYPSYNLSCAVSDDTLVQKIKQKNSMKHSHTFILDDQIHRTMIYMNDLHYDFIVWQLWMYLIMGCNHL